MIEKRFAIFDLLLKSFLRSMSIFLTIFIDIELHPKAILFHFSALFVHLLSMLDSICILLWFADISFAFIKLTHSKIYSSFTSKAILNLSSFLMPSITLLSFFGLWLSISISVSFKSTFCQLDSNSSQLSFVSSLIAFSAFLSLIANFWEDLL